MNQLAQATAYTRWALSDGKITRQQEMAQALTEGQIRVEVKATSLNYRDLLIKQGNYAPVDDGTTVLSDAAAVVTEVAPDVTRWKVGDRVIPLFFQQWQQGRLKPEYMASALGGEQDGVLAQQRVFDQHSVVAIPDYLTDEQAATLPCAALTAWHALFERGRKLGQGDTLLIQGTGGVALFALRFAKAIGADVIVTSSSDQKLERTKSLGATGGINYLETPEWSEQVMEKTQGQGADIVLELGGPDTFQHSINSVAAGGMIAQIGVLTGWSPQPELGRLVPFGADISGILVGSGEQFERMLTFMEQHQIEPVIDSIWPVEHIEQAFDHLESGKHMGKVVVSL